MKVIETQRLLLRWLTIEDAEFILALVNEPAWLQFIGDRGIKTLDDSRSYIEKGPLEMYRTYGFGLYLVELKATGSSIGICGLIKRPTLEDVDLGFAFLSRFCGQGYALESAVAVLSYGRNTLGMNRIVAITAPANQPSIKLLGKLGFCYERSLRLNADAAEVDLYASDSGA